MGETLKFIIASFGGSVVGGLLALLGTYISLKGEYKKQRETDERHFEQKRIWHAIDKKEKLYLDFAKIVSKLLIFEPEFYIDSEKCEIKDIKFKGLEEAIEDLSVFHEINKGEIELYMSSEIKQKFLSLRSCIFETENMTLDVNNIGDVFTKITKEVTSILYLMKKDLRIIDDKQAK